MNYKVLYRKYRPDDFDNLVGQEKIVKILKNSIIEKKLSHAYIFSGPRGTGKTSSAKIFAKNVNCLDPIDGLSCGKCTNCTNIGNSSDIIEIDAASNNGVDEIRELINNVKLVPTLLKYKVYIIDEVHMLSNNAFNALLLTLEEPPAHVIFVLATTNIESVPITILSRCQRFDFRKINNNDIFNRLKDVCEKESIDIDDEAIMQIAKLSDGGLRDSLSLLDQLSKENDKISEEIVINYSGNVSSRVITNIIKLLNDNNAIDLERVLMDLFNNSIDHKLLLKGLITEISNEVREIVINNKKSRLIISEYKKLIVDLTDFQNKINVNVDVYSILLVILFNYLEFESVNLDIEKSVNKEKEEIISKRESKINETTIETNVSIESEEKVINNKIENIIKEEVVDNNLENLKKVRINNCFAEASKEEKLKIMPIWDKFSKDSDMLLRGLLMDTTVAMCSSRIITICIDRENDLKELEENYKLLINNFYEITNLEHIILLLTKKNWDDLVIKYKNDKDNGIIYVLEDESKYLENEKVYVGDIFDNVEEI